MAKVLLFGPLRDIAGWREKDVRANTVAELKAALTAEDAALGAALNGKGVQVAIDQRIMRNDTGLRANAEVAFLPPMSGG